MAAQLAASQEGLSSVSKYYIDVRQTLQLISRIFFLYHTVNHGEMLFTYDWISLHTGD
jgi:hypothetical protein